MSDNDLIRRGDALALFLAIDDLRHMNVGQATVLFAERRAALIALPAAQPTVKPLVWVGSVAKTSFGNYYIVDLGPLWVAPGRFDVSFSVLDVARAEDEQSAKAAAQADYETRILSALDMQPTVSPDVAALVEAVRALRDAMHNNIVVNDEPHTVVLPDGSCHSGPVVDFLHALVGAQISVLDAALARVKGETK